MLEIRESPTGAVVLAFPVRPTTAPRGVREVRGGGLLPSRRPIVSPFGELPALPVRREKLEEEILELWEG